MAGLGHRCRVRRLLLQLSDRLRDFNASVQKDLGLSIAQVGRYISVRRHHPRLFTHMHKFWVIGLLLAFIDIPDFGGFLGRIAGSVEKMADAKPEQDADEITLDAATRRTASVIFRG